MKFYKITNEEENHRGMKYKDGLNVDINPFDSLNECSYGIYFSQEDIFGFLRFGPWIREVTLLKDGKLYKESGNKWSDSIQWRADKIVLGPRRSWNDYSIFKELIVSGANIHADDDLALILASKYSNVDVVKYLVENGASIHVRNDLALRYACKNGCLEIVKYLVENGASIGALCHSAILLAIKNKHFDVVNYLIEQCIDDYLYCTFGNNCNFLDSTLRDNARIEVIKILFFHMKTFIWEEKMHPLK